MSWATAPLHEVGHDEEIAGETHRLDDADLALQAAPVDVFAVFGRRGVQPFAQALPRLGGEFLGLRSAALGGEVRQDGIALLDHEGAAAGDLQGVVAGLGQIGEQAAHV